MYRFLLCLMICVAPRLYGQVLLEMPSTVIQPDCSLLLDSNGKSQYPAHIFACKTIQDNAAMGNGKMQVVQLQWSDELTEGRFYLVILPDVIYLRGGHENPNPNYLYWIAEIKPFQYSTLVEAILNGDSKKIRRVNTLAEYKLTYSRFDEKEFTYALSKKEDARLHFLSEHRQEYILRTLTDVLTELNTLLTAQSREMISLPKTEDVDKVLIRD